MVHHLGGFQYVLYGNWHDLNLETPWGVLLTSKITKAFAKKCQLSINEEHWSKNIQFTVLADSLRFAELYIQGQRGKCVVASLPDRVSCIHQTGSKKGFDGKPTNSDSTLQNNNMIFCQNLRGHCFNLEGGPTLESAFKTTCFQALGFPNKVSPPWRVSSCTGSNKIVSGFQSAYVGRHFCIRWSWIPSVYIWTQNLSRVVCFESMRERRTW